MLDVVAPFDHKQLVPAVEFNTTDPPEQNVVGPAADIVGALGVGLTVTEIELLAALWQPDALVTLQVNVPAVVTVMFDVVAPFDHKQLVPAVEFNTTDPPEQNVVGPAAEIVGALGVGLTVTEIELLAVL